MRFRLRTLLIVAALAPPILAVVAALGTIAFVNCSERIPGDEDPVERTERHIREGQFGYEKDGYGY